MVSLSSLRVMGIHFIVIFVIFLKQSVAVINVFLPSEKHDYTFELPRGPDEVVMCRLDLPTGEFCSHGAATVPLEDCLPIINIDTKVCSIRILKVEEKHMGMFKLSAIYANNVQDEQDYTLYLKRDGFPKGEVTVIEHENIYLRAIKSIDVTDCSATFSDNSVEQLMASSVITSSFYWGAKGECGLQIVQVTSAYQGKITLFSNGGKTYSYADFDVNVILKKNIEVNTDPVDWILRKEGYIDMTRPSSKYCEVWNPLNQKVLTSNTNCEYEESFVKSSDHGFWSFIYGMTGKVQEDLIKRRINVIPDTTFSTSVEESIRFFGGYDLLCSISPNAVSDCRFVRPDKEVILPDEGIGDSKYSYFGDGLDLGHCGLSIHILEDVDEGWWQCSVKTISEERTGYLDVFSNEAPDIWPEEETVLAEEEAELTLTCYTQNPLKYCWFNHPSGVYLLFSIEEVNFPEQTRKYKYKDSLSKGECTIIIDKTNKSMDSGKWSCNLGLEIYKNEDLSVNIDVKIAETDMVSYVNELTFEPGATSLKCFSVPRKSSLEYCRFIRPDGKGFHLTPGDSNLVMGRYEYDATGLAAGECSMKITAGEVLQEELGMWSCVARKQGQNKEGYANIRLVKTEAGESSPDSGLPASTIAGIATGGAGVLILIIGLIIIIIKCSIKERTHFPSYMTQHRSRI